MTISLSTPQPDGLCDTGQGTQCRTWGLVAHTHSVRSRQGPGPQASPGARLVQNPASCTSRTMACSGGSPSMGEGLSWEVEESRVPPHHTGPSLLRTYGCMAPICWGSDRWLGDAQSPRWVTGHQRPARPEPPGRDRQRGLWACQAGIPGLHFQGRWGGRGRVPEQASRRRPPCLSYQETHPVSVWLLFVAVGYALQLTKNSLKNNHFLSAERQGENAGARHTHTHSHTHAHPCSNPFAFQDQLLGGGGTGKGLRQRRPQWLTCAAPSGPAQSPAPHWS